MKTYSGIIKELTLSSSDIKDKMPYITTYISKMEMEEIICEVNQALQPDFCYTLYEQISLNENSISIGQTTLKCGHKIVSLLKGSQKIAVISCTIGTQITEICNAYSQNYDYMKAYICDILANAAIEKLTNHIKKTLRHDPENKGLSITSHFSPGYCEWNIEEQPLLLSLLPQEQCPVILTSSCLMIPVKSISGIIGIGKNVQYKESSCDLCRLPNCIYKKQVRHTQNEM